MVSFADFMTLLFSLFVVLFAISSVDQSKLSEVARKRLATIKDSEDGFFIAEQDLKLRGAGEMLRSTDLPVSSIGYRCGYLNNASFTRAFSRHYGVAPTQYRAHRLAA